MRKKGYPVGKTRFLFPSEQQTIQRRGVQYRKRSYRRHYENSCDGLAFSSQSPEESKHRLQPQQDANPASPEGGTHWYHRTKRDSRRVVPVLIRISANGSRAPARTNQNSSDVDVDVRWDSSLVSPKTNERLAQS